MFDHPEFDNHENVVYVQDPDCGLKAIVAIHSTDLGPAFGGCRMWPYADEAEALTDVLRLSRGMTFKAAICEVPLGGGKSVILGDPKTDKSEALLRAMGRQIEKLGGSYVVAEDVGTTLADLVVMREEPGFTAAATAAAQEPLAVTAYGVLMAIEAIAEVQFGHADLSGLQVSVQGLGNVGAPLCQYLWERGVDLTVTDIDAERVRLAVEAYGARGVAAEAIYDRPADIFAPCALGAVLNDDTVPRLQVRAVCGGANNPLERPDHAAALAARGICYVPDYLSNAGGVIDYHQESIDDSPAAVLASVERIRGIARDILGAAAGGNGTPLEIADRRVRRRLRAARDGAAR